MKNQWLLIPFFLALSSCAGKTDHYRDIDTEIHAASYPAAIRSMESGRARRNIYQRRNEILYHLDRGMIEHHAGLWEDSSRSLQTGERLIEEAFTKSISQEIGSYIANDNTKDYAGEDYEDLYINVFNALNYYHRGNLEDALVEIRRLNEKLLYLSGKYEVAKQKVLNSNNDLAGNSDYVIEAKNFSNSALARYLGVLFYRAVGNRDGARIDMGELREAYELAPSVYYNPPPLSLEEELSVPRGTGRLNIISFTGLSPVKEETNLSIRMPFDPPNHSARLALPQMVNRPSAIRSIEVIVESPDTYNRLELELLEDMGMVARETFTAKYGLILLKTTARTIAKVAVSARLAKTAEDEDVGLGLLVGVLGAAASAASERADLRIARYFPAYAHVGGVNLDPGIYSVRVNYHGTAGLIGTEIRENVQVRAGRLNLTEFICLK
jgi:hypothetical protein